MRIGELSRRSGVAPELLRAWERRYALLEPTRSSGGYRLYSESDLSRLRAMQAQLAAGLSAAEAAAAAIAETSGTPPTPALERPGAAIAELAAAFDRYDEASAHAVLDRALATVTVDAVMSDLVLPYLAQLGDRWARGEISVAQEHFASNVLRGRLMGLARGWDRGSGARAVLLCAPGELHELALIAFGLALRSRGWSIAYLGADTPIATAVDAARELTPTVVVVAATMPERLAECAVDLTRLAGEAAVALAGVGATGELAERIGARLLTGDPVTEAERLTRAMGAQRIR